MRIFLAPMEGVIDHHMRFLLTSIGGIDLCTTEFIRVNDHTLPQKVFFRYCPELLQASEQTGTDTAGNDTSDNYASDNYTSDNYTSDNYTSCPVKVQLLGSCPETLANNALRAAALGAVGIDLNFGCPAKTVNRHRGGACLLNEPDMLYEIVHQVRQALPANISVSAKIRLGFADRQSGLRNAIAIEKAGADEITVHARSKVDGYKPPAYWKDIAEINQTVNIPVIANGDIWTVGDFLRCREESTCKDIMLGRCLLACPDLALQIRAVENGQNYTALTWQQVAGLVLEYFLLTKNQYPKKFMGNRVKQWLFYLKIRFPEARDLFEKIKKERDAFILEDHLSQQAHAGRASTGGKCFRVA